MIINLNNLSFPAWDLLPVNSYDSLLVEKPFITMMTSRGCPYQCAFCFKQPMDKHIRYRSAQNIVDEIEYCMDKWGIKSVVFYDDTIGLNCKHLEDICWELLLRKVKIKWDALCRVDNTRPEILELMAQAGCCRIRYGVESGSPRILKMMNKRITYEQVHNAFRWTKEANIETLAYFMIGYLTETPGEIRQTVRLACELNPDWVLFSIVTPMPKTVLFDQCVEAGVIDEDCWFTGNVPHLIPNAEKWTAWAYRKFYLRVPYILRRLSQLRSLNDVKQQWRGLKAILTNND